MTDAAFLLQQRGLRWISLPKRMPRSAALCGLATSKQDLLLLPTVTDAP